MVAFYIGCSQGSVNVFYSLHWRLSTMSKRIVADILMWKDCTIAVNYMDVQWQSAWRRCWSWAIFAQVFSTTLSAGDNPSTGRYHTTSPTCGAIWWGVSLMKGNCRGLLQGQVSSYWTDRGVLLTSRWRQNHGAEWTALQVVPCCLHVSACWKNSPRT